MKDIKSDKKSLSSYIKNFYDDSKYVENAEKLNQSNLKFYILFDKIMIALLLALYISTFFTDYAESLTPIYLIFIMLSILELIFVPQICGKHDNWILGVTYYGIAKAYIFCLFSSVIFNPNGPAITFHVFLILIPVAFIVRPRIMMRIQTLTVIAYCVCTIIFKSSEYISGDIFTVLLFYVISIAISDQISRLRISNVSMANLAKKHALELEDSQDLLEVALNHADMTVWEYDLEKKRIYPSFASSEQRRLQTAFENMPEAAIQKGWICQESVEAFRKIFADAAAGEAVSQNDIHSMKADKSGDCWVRIRLVEARSQENGKTRYVGSTVDITHQKKIENEYEEQIKVLDSVNEDNLITKGQWNLTQNRQEMVESKGKTAVPLKEGITYDAASALLIKGIIPESRKEEVKKILKRETLIEQFDKGVASYTLKYQRKAANQDIIWVSMKMRLCKVPGKNEIVVFAYSMDISDDIFNKRIIQQLVNDQFKFLGTFVKKTGRSEVRICAEQYEKQFTELGIYKASQDYTVSMKALVEKSVVEEEKAFVMEKLSMQEVLRQLDSQGSYSLTFSVMEQDQLYRKQLKYIYMDEAKEVVLYSRDDITEMYESEQRHIREMKNSLEQAEKANAAKTEFLSNMSHDMRTPMNGIMGLAALIKDKTDVNEIKKDVEQINLSGRYLLNLINDTLDMNKIESGKLELRLKPVNREEVLRHVLTNASLMAKEKKIQLNVEMSKLRQGSHTSVMADASRIEQVMMNILSNAIKYSDEGSTVNLDVETIFEDEAVVTDCYTVTDHGIGMSEEYLPYLFEPFTQEGRRNTERQNGTGLGMSIVKQLVDMMDGKIEVNSELNQGTSIAVTLSFQKSGEDVSAKETEPVDLSVLKKTHILLCEDHPLNRQIAAKMLEKKEVAVTCAENGKKGLELFEQALPGTFDLILMDIRMPVMDGLEAARRIRALPGAQAKEIPIVAMTANAYDTDIQASMEVGMNAHLAKPIDVSLLYQTLAGLIQQRKKAQKAD